MAFEVIDGFDQYNTPAAQVQFGWASSNATIVSTNTAFNYGQSLQLSSGAVCNYNMSGSFGTFYVFGRFKIDVGGAVNCPLLTLLDTATVQTTISIDGTGTNQVKCYRGTVAGTLLGTSAGTFARGSWHTIYAKITTSNSLPNLGDYQIYIDGTLQINLAATTNTRSSANSSCNITRLGQSNAANYYMDDFFISDTLMTTALTDTPRVYVLVPSGNGTTNQFTNSAGNSTNNYSYVNSVNQQTTTFVSDSVVGEVDLYANPSLPYIPNSIFGTCGFIYANADNASAKTARILVRSAGVNYESADCIMASSVGYFKDIRAVDPATSAAWTYANLVASQQGIKVQA